ncbi:MAG: sulfatase/phosphatase domain-containing protein, partial [Singulisphaera sp.]
MNGKSTKARGYTTDILGDLALSFLGHQDDRPFLLYLSHKGLHPETKQNADGSLSDPTARTSSRRSGTRTFTRRPRSRPAERRRHTRREAGPPQADRRAPPLGPGTGTSDESVRERQRMLASIDEGVGRLREELERTGRFDDTAFIFTSDHGYFYGEHGLGTERRLAYEEAIRVPLLVRYPPLIRARMTVDPIVISPDVAPTLLELGGAAYPARLHGRSILPLLRGEVARLHASFLVEHSSDKVFPRVEGLGYQAVRTGRWKYIRYRDLQGMDELYDLSADPFEMRNLVDELVSTRAADSHSALVYVNQVGG